MKLWVKMIVTHQITPTFYGSWFSGVKTAKEEITKGGRFILGR